MSNYKLIYFNIRGRAEIIRYIFAYLDIKYEDHRIEQADWPKIKPSKYHKSFRLKQGKCISGVFILPVGNASPILQSFTLRNISSGKPSRCMLLSGLAQDFIIFFLNRWLRTIERAGQLMSAWVLPLPRADPANLHKLPQHHFLIEETTVNTISQGWELGDWCACDSFVLRSLSSSTCHLSPVCLRWSPSISSHPWYLEFCPAHSPSGPWTALALLTGLVIKAVLFPQSERSWLCAHLVYVWRLGPM